MLILKSAWQMKSILNSLLVRIYLMLIVLGAILITFDHLTSNALTDVGSPSEMGNACAPCGAPCDDNQSE